jgi:hypothetical protein
VTVAVGGAGLGSAAAGTTNNPSAAATDGGEAAVPAAGNDDAQLLINIMQSVCPGLLAAMREEGLFD